jgi:hypothetical protein
VDRGTTNPETQSPAIGALWDEQTRDSTNNCLNEGGTRSMYPMGQLRFDQDKPVDIGCTEYLRVGKQFYLGAPKTPCEWKPDDVLDQEMTIVFCTNTLGFSFPVGLRGNILKCTARRTNVDSNGQIKPDSKPDSMHHAIIAFIETLVDAEKGKILFQFCSS